MGMFGVSATRDCTCPSCVALREVKPAQRVGQGFGVLVALVMAIGGLALVGALIVWGIVAVVRQL